MNYTINRAKLPIMGSSKAINAQDDNAGGFFRCLLEPALSEGLNRCVRNKRGYPKMAKTLQKSMSLK